MDVLSSEAENPLRSDTQELAWYHSGARTGLDTVDTPRTQALIGFVKNNHQALHYLSAAMAPDGARVPVGTPATPWYALEVLK